MTGKPHVSLCLLTAQAIQEEMLSFLQARFPSLALQVDSWFQLTEKPDIHLESVTRTDTVDPDNLLTPNQDLLKVILLERDTSHNSEPRPLIHPQEDSTTIAKTNGSSSQAELKMELIRQAAKFPVAFHYYYLFQTGHLHHRLGLNSTSKCQFCHSDHRRPLPNY
ncbi:unnamed protein product [Ambrosiozyma monospora]|uniref:Unnamed protein product n=1 Tax=Ambrosiozyma monospora TaxID=43982 RepID=A0A9W6YT99_AMBMO|nr:unnamed protein product [Ambrosiozyma monospora]